MRRRGFPRDRRPRCCGRHRGCSSATLKRGRPTRCGRPGTRSRRCSRPRSPSRADRCWSAGAQSSHTAQPARPAEDRQAARISSEPCDLPTERRNERGLWISQAEQVASGTTLRPRSRNTPTYRLSHVIAQAEGCKGLFNIPYRTELFARACHLNGADQRAMRRDADRIGRIACWLAGQPPPSQMPAARRPAASRAVQPAPRRRAE